MHGVTNIDELVAYLGANDIRRHKLAVFDIDGIMRGKYVERDKFVSACKSGLSFCDVVLGWDSADALYDNAKVSGWHTGYRDAPVEIDLSTLRRIAFEEDTVVAFGNFVGDYAGVCPRGLLERQIDRARGLGFGVKAALEYEFFVFDETPQSIRDKGYRDLRPFTPGMFGYSMLRQSVHADLYHELLDTMAEMDCDIEGLHTETGPGVIEAALRYDDCLRAADKGALFKTFAKVWAQRRGLMATFMAKWSTDLPGQSGHIHLSLVDASTGDNRFWDAADEHGMSATLRHFIAGQVKYMPEVLPMVCSTINAYRRMVPGMWAPTASNWGVENRTTAVRVVPGGPTGQRSEYRIGPADANPYLALAAALGTGLRGIEEQLEPPPMVVGNGHPPTAPQSVPLPCTLREATLAFESSATAIDLFGAPFVEHFAATRHWEDRQSRKHVSDWDLARYFEII